MVRPRKADLLLSSGYRFKTVHHAPSEHAGHARFQPNGRRQRRSRGRWIDILMVDGPSRLRAFQLSSCFLVGG